MDRNEGVGSRGHRVRLGVMGEYEGGYLGLSGRLRGSSHAMSHVKFHVKLLWNLILGVCVMLKIYLKA